MRALGRAIRFRVPICSSRVLLGLESSVRDRSRNRLSRADVFESSPVRGCKYERYVQYISTYEQIQQVYKTRLYNTKIGNLSDLKKQKRRV